MTATPSAGGTIPALEPGGLAALDDHALMAAVQDGSAEAFESFYARHKPGVLSFCRHILGNREDAEDAVQHTFMAAYRQVQNEGPPAHPSAWLYKVARNRCLTMIRTRHESPGDTVEPATAGLAEEVEWRFELRELLRDLSRLPEEQRAALILFELGGLNQTEVGEVLESSPDKVKALVYQARHGLMDRAVARETECREIRRRLSTLRGGRLNDRTLRHHLDVCAGCRAFRADVTLQRRGLALLLPVVPVADFHARILALLGLGGAAGGGGAAAGASHTGASGRAHLGAQSTPAKLVAAGVAVTAVTAGLALGLSGGHGARQVSDQRSAAPAAPAAVAQPAAAKAPPRHRAARSHRTKRRHRSPARASARATTRTVAAVAPQPPAAAAPQNSSPRAAPRRSPARTTPVAAPKPKSPAAPAPTAPAGPAPTAPAAPAPAPPTPAPEPPAPVATPPTPPPPPPPTPTPGGGHRNGPPGPVGNPQPHGPPPGWDPGKSPKR